MTYKIYLSKLSLADLAELHESHVCSFEETGDMLYATEAERVEDELARRLDDCDDDDEDEEDDVCTNCGVQYPLDSRVTLARGICPNCVVVN